MWVEKQNAELLKNVQTHVFYAWGRASNGVPLHQLRYTAASELQKILSWSALRFFWIILERVFSFFLVDSN